MRALNVQGSFASLSLKDLLAARDAYHWHLMNKANVVGTAVGLYMLRKAGVDELTPRTFDNSEVRGDSRPCLLVLVNDWLAATDFGGDEGVDPAHMIPRLLFLPDGRTAPVCVVLVRPGVAVDGAPAPARWPETFIGGGCPILATVQGETRMASVGCLVSDGHRHYALTNRHVAGEAGEEISANLRGIVTPVGHASLLSAGRIPFSEVFPDYGAQRSYLTVDVGLIDVDVASDWTSRPFGLVGEVGPVADLNEGNLGTQLIGLPVEAFGAASGHLTGTIKALFYRHKAIAGYDYVSEFLIAPNNAAAQTQPGDSGTVWYAVEEDATAGRTLYPLAVEWGGQGLIGDGGERLNFTLATGLSTICELLDVDVVREHDTGATPFWGQVGHYSIAAAAISAVQQPMLSAFLNANLEQISFRPDELTPEQIRAAIANGDFCELADVPDLVWKQVKGVTPGGRDEKRNVGAEHPNHYADIDRPDAAGGPCLRDLVIGDPTKMTPAAWSVWYAANGQTDPEHQGLLPFRVWQLFRIMVDALRAHDVERFLCAAGVVSHYVGDACQPLHGSYLSNGYQDRPVPSTGKFPRWAGEGVHSAYEDKMVDAKSAVLLPMIGPAAQAFTAPIPPMTSGQEAALATVRLMAHAASVIAPAELCDRYIALGGGTSKKTLAGLWHTFGPRTAKVMGAGARYLAALWEGAYAAAGGPVLAPAAISRIRLAALYQDDTFAPSRTLDTIETEL